MHSLSTPIGSISPAQPIVNQNIKHSFVAACWLVLPLSAAAQAPPAAAVAAEAQTVQQTITAFFDGMRRADSTAVRRTLASGAVFHVINSRSGQTRLQPENPSDFVKAVGTPHQEVWDERISFDKILIDANLASVWTPYEFYLDSKFSHCGYNSFQLVKLTEGWHIAHVIDTRRKEQCK